MSRHVKSYASHISLFNFFLFPVRVYRSITYSEASLAGIPFTTQRCKGSRKWLRQDLIKIHNSQQLTVPNFSLRNCYKSFLRTDFRAFSWTAIAQLSRSWPWQCCGRFVDKVLAGLRRPLSDTLVVFITCDLPCK